MGNKTAFHVYIKTWCKMWLITCNGLLLARVASGAQTAGVVSRVRTCVFDFRDTLVRKYLKRATFAIAVLSRKFSIRNLSELRSNINMWPSL